MIHARTRKWGNSIGIVLPKKEVERLKISENQNIVVEISAKNPLKELFGSGTKRITERERKEFRDMLESNYVLP